jgi:DNA-directed RNA polymerase subunit N (RpoN/RPB10)
MIIPIRCQSCGKPIAHLWEKFKAEIKRKNAGEVLDELGLERYCCRTVFLTHVDLIHDIEKFKR